MKLKRWVLLALVGIVLAISFFALRFHQSTGPPQPRSHLLRTANSAYKFHLCTEAFAFAFATSETPYKTDYTFQDPFRKMDDTIIPRLLNRDSRDDSVSFSVKIIINQISTFNETIAHVHVLDGISVMLPDNQEQLQRSGVPQFIVSSLDKTGNLAVLDYTCPDQWIWKTVKLA